MTYFKWKKCPNQNGVQMGYNSKLNPSAQMTPYKQNKFDVITWTETHKVINVQQKTDVQRLNEQRTIKQAFPTCNMMEKHTLKDKTFDFFLI